MTNKGINVKEYMAIINSMVEKNILNHLNTIENSYNNPYSAKIKNCGNHSKARPP